MESGSKILIVEDEKKIAGWIKIYLEKAGFETSTAFDGAEGLKIYEEMQPDLILLDLMIPKIRGDEVCSRIRQKSDVPIIILTARNAKRDVLDGLERGADDYICKPFDPEELVGRIKAVLRRSRRSEPSMLQCGPLKYDRDTGVFTVDGEELPLSQAQLSIMMVFMENPNIILSRARLIESAFQSRFSGYERAIDNHIKRIRHLIHKKDFNPIKTIYGGGYKLECSKEK